MIFAAALLLAAGAGAYWFWFRPPILPPLDLSGSDPAVREAVEAAAGRVREAPAAAGAWGELGMVLLANDFIEPARSALARAAALDPAQARWPYLDALASLKGVPDGPRAIACLERAARAAPNDPLPRLRLGEELLEQGRVEEAEARFREALASAPGDSRGELGLARVAHRRGKWNEALAHLERSAASAPEVRSTRVLLAEIHFRLGNREAADRERSAARALPEMQEWPDPHQGEVRARWTGALAKAERADGLFRSGRREEAFDLLRRTAREQPETLLPRLLLGRLLLQAGQAAAAEAELREAARRAPEAFEAHHELAAALEKQGKTAEAAESYRRAITKKPDYGPAHTGLAQCLFRLGDREGAIAELRESLRYRPDSSQAQRELGRLLAQKGEYQEALDRLRSATQLNPADPEARALLEAVSRK